MSKKIFQFLTIQILLNSSLFISLGSTKTLSCTEAGLECENCCKRKPIEEQNLCIKDCNILIRICIDRHDNQSNHCVITAVLPPSPAKSCWWKIWQCPDKPWAE